MWRNATLKLTAMESASTGDGLCLSSKKRIRPIATFPENLNWESVGPKLLVALF